MKVKWNTEIYDLGDIKVGEEHLGEFVIKDDSTIESVVPSCLCTNVTTGQDKKVITFSYKGESVPEHLKEKGFFYINKKLDVTVFNDALKTKQHVFLYIKAKIYENK